MKYLAIRKFLKNILKFTYSNIRFLCISMNGAVNFDQCAVITSGMLIPLQSGIGTVPSSQERMGI